MMRLTRGTSLVVAFYLLTSAGTAFAECAWVLWSRSMVYPGGKTPVNIEWDRLGSVNTRERCLAMMANTGTRRTGSGVKEYESYGMDPQERLTVRTVFESGDVNFDEYSCWPDTIDPSLLKAK